jgi:thiamine biosynthesis lipoprotein
MFRRLWLVALLLAGCGGEGSYQRYVGTTMGTYYQVTARCPGDVASLIERELRAVNDEMSTYLPDSALSRFNRAPPAQWFPVTPQLAEVVAAAGVLYRESGGAFDVTVGPLVNLWGFGPTEQTGIPAPEAVAAALERVGHQHLDVQHDPPKLRKRADLYVDLSAIAKGHGVDRVLSRLREAECSAVLVDVGGEVRGMGRSPSGRAWRIGVEVPDPDDEGGIQRVIRLDEAAVATSGDYRNFLESGGRRYSHTIDPRTGFPVEHGLASVTVLHDSAMWADGYATLLNVLGPDAGMAFARERDLAALFIIRTESGFAERYTQALGAALVE